MIYTGIDPGKQGGVCRIFPENFLSIAYFSKNDSPLVHGLDELIYMEKVGPRPNQSAISGWTFAVAVGRLEGMLKAWSKPINYVLPQVWQKELGLYGITSGMTFKSNDAEKRYRKKKYQEYAINTFPKYEKQITLEVADAVCIAIYAKLVSERKEFDI